MQLNSTVFIKTGKGYHVAIHTIPEYVEMIIIDDVL